MGMRGFQARASIGLSLVLAFLVVVTVASRWVDRKPMHRTPISLNPVTEKPQTRKTASRPVSNNGGNAGRPIYLPPPPVRSAQNHVAKPAEKPVLKPAPKPAPQPVQVKTPPRKTHPVRVAKRKIRPPVPILKIPKSDPIIHPTPATRQEGRTLLRLLEHGKGPNIEIAWPESPSARNRLYVHFRKCLGMENAVMGFDGNLYGENNQRNRPWKLDLDRYSGFLRHPKGQMIGAERSRAGHISGRHAIRSGRLVRIFPRNVDAVMLGGLRSVIGETYAVARNITATYASRNGLLVLSAIRVNGRAMGGLVRLGAMRRTGCRITGL